MKLSRRQFTKAASGAIAFASLPAVLKKSGIASEEPIRVANILDRTGGLNIYSLKQMQAVAMAADEINADGGLLGRPVEVMFYDSQSENQYNQQYTTQALLRDGAHVVQGGITSSSREVMRPIIHRFESLLFYNALYEGGVCDRRHVCPGMVPAQQLEALVPYVVNELGGKRGYILAADYNYGHITSRWLQKIIRDNGGEDLAVEFFPLDVSNFAPAIARIQDAKPDVVWSALVGAAHNGFYRQFHEVGGKEEMLLAATTYGAGRVQVELSADEGEDILVATSFHDDLGTEAANSFVERFKEYSGEDDYIGEYGEYGYRGTMLWAEAVRRAESPEPDAVIEALGGTSFDGPGGLYTIDGQTNHVIMDVHIARGNREHSFDVVRSYEQQQPLDVQMVCDLEANPDDNTQYEIELD